MAVKERKTGESRNRFGTFEGVFTPSILTILGVIMFMRASFVIGEAGILGAIIILLIAKLITFMTSLSIAAISTNMQVRGGGAYYLISRVLGPEFGGAIGLALFFAVALSVPFYILGFTEALCLSFTGLAPYFQEITLLTAAVFFVIAYVGTGWALRLQFFIMIILTLAILAFLGGAATNFTISNFENNWQPGYTVLKSGQTQMFSFWIIFAIYFPAVTGINAGLNMSGDLKDPARSIPRGTLLAVGVGLLVYLVQIILCGGAFQRELLLSQPYAVLKENALFNLGFIVAAGVYAATLSSALGSYLGAPRVLQALSRDPVVPLLKPFAKGSVRGNEPRRALAATGIITLAVLFWAGNEAGGGALNAVAAIITMFFLYSYGMINFAAFIEALGRNPSFRPSFKYFHWLTALVGTVGCIAVAFLINTVAALVAMVIIAIIYFYTRSRQLSKTFGDARRGFVYSAARKNLLLLAEMREDSRNWRPTILVFSVNPKSREILASFAVWLESGRGFVLLTQILVGDLAEYLPHRSTAEKKILDLCREKKIQAFPIVVAAKSVAEGVANLLQTAAVGPIKPNLVVFGWTTNGVEGASILLSQLQLAKSLALSLVVIKAECLPVPGKCKRIDIWWRGLRNGQTMIILAWLLAGNWEWADCEIRILRVVENEAGQEPAAQALKKLLGDARVEATVKIIASGKPFLEILRKNSRDATCVFLGLELPETRDAGAWYSTYNSFMQEMPATILICSGRETDLLTTEQ